MKSLCETAFKLQIQAKTGFEFEKFIDKLFLLKYGSDGYVPIREIKDKGNDGTILKEKKVLACYAPKDKPDKRKFERKVKDDFDKYKNHWQKEYPSWEMLVNYKVPQDQLNLIKELEGNTSIKGIDQILSIIDDLNSSQRRKLAVYLGIEDTITQDYVNDIIEDLLNYANKDGAFDFNKLSLTPPGEKIKLNFKEEDWEGIESEMKEAMPVFKIIEKILSEYTDNEKTMIKRRVIDDYNKLSGDLKLRLKNLTEQYTRQHSNLSDDDYRLNVRALLLYMFEQCKIGKNKE